MFPAMHYDMVIPTTVVCTSPIVPMHFNRQTTSGWGSGDTSLPLNPFPAPDRGDSLPHHIRHLRHVTA
jgi:hypothetical protein